MLYNYIALLFFSAFAAIVPAGLLVASKLIRPRIPGNPVKNSPYESAEESIGTNRDIDNEYLPFFTMFLPFEIIAVLLLVWAGASSSVPFGASAMILLLLVISTGFAVFGYLIRGKNGQ
ncbi:MAG: NADH-quinone oxidoreductase subunit A [Candidatus Micrarchaeota archaeon]|nr:NADH-quinone oxidoreductase subunit A [Candidatus Micrarchaeota archaeon]